jgi:hypothetical protein
MKMAQISVERAGLKFLPVEKVLVGYLLLTGLLLLSRFGSLEHPASHLILRGLVLVVILLLAYFSKPWNNKTFRILWPLALLPYLYSETDFFNNILFTRNLDPFFSDVEFAVFQSQPSLIFSARFPSDAFAEIMYLGYVSYYFMILLVPVAMYFFHNQGQIERVGFILIHSFLLYYMIYIILPVGGPQFYFVDSAMDLPEGYLFGPLLRFIQKSFEGPTAAFPSSHISICLMLIWIAYHHVRPLFLYLLPISILLMFSTVYIQAHYVIDILAGIAVTPIFYVFSERMYAFLMRKRIKEPYLLNGGYQRGNVHPGKVK